MKNSAAYLLSVTLLLALGFGFSSCKDDDPPAKPKLSFAESEMTVSEAAGTIDVELVLDKPHSKDLRIEYELGGTAGDQDDVGTANADYEVVGDHGVVKIESGETSAVIKLKIYSDAAFEPDETIEIAIVDINTDEVELTENDEIEITITNDDVQLQLSFATQSITVNEADGAVDVQLVLDKPAPQNLTFNYQLSGSATDSITAWNEDKNADYYIHGKAGEVQFTAGQTTAKIEIRLFSDLLVEDSNPNTEAIDPETIVITMSPGGVQMTDTDMEIKIVQEDGLLIALFWPDPAGGQQADMDLLLRVGNSTTEWLGVLTGSASEGFESPEIIFIPNVLNFAAYGLSYTYYDGTLDPLPFEVVFIDIVDGALESAANSLSFEATYTAVNKNKWTNVSSTKVVQTFEKTETGFSTPSAITVPNEGSRVRSTDKFVSPLKKGDIKLATKTYRYIERYRSR